jgi:hypothetical protein
MNLQLKIDSARISRHLDRLAEFTDAPPVAMTARSE